MASLTAPGSICHVPRPTDGILAPVLRTKDSAIFVQEGKTESGGNGLTESGGNGLGKRLSTKVYMGRVVVVS